MPSYDDLETRATGLGLATLMVVGLACGWTMLSQGNSALSEKPTRRLRLPSLWMMVGGFSLALVTGLGLWEVEGIAPLLAPWFIVVVAALPPLTAVVWAAEDHPGQLTWRRSSVAFSAGATVSVLLAILLEILVPYTIIWLLLNLGDPVLDAIEGLLNLLAGGEVARALTAPGLLVALFELAIVAPLVEEFVKPLVVLPLLKSTESRRDVFLIGAVAGAGFAALENVIYALVGVRYWSGILLLRALGAAVHPLGAGLTALAWHSILTRRRNQVLPPRSREEPGFWPGGFGLAVGQHALWNGGLVLWMALAGTTFFGPAPAEADVMGISVAVGLLALIALEGVALWMAIRALSRRLDLDKDIREVAADQKEIARVDMSTERAIALWAVVCLLVLLPVGLAALQALQF
jgi:RsiW-degrading membrane proteinase PrsW (M82 family)